MPKIIVVNNNVEQALKEFKWISGDVRRNKKRYEYYLRPGLKKRLKSKEAKKKKKHW